MSIARTAATTACSLVIAASLSATVCTATAHAADIGVIFLIVARERGIEFADPNAAPDLAFHICDAFDAGHNYAAVDAESEQSPAVAGFSPGDVVVVIQTAVELMCPQYTSELPQ